MNAGTFSMPTRPHVLPSQTTRVATALGTAFVTISRDADGHPLEVFMNVGKAGSETYAAAEALGRLVSLALRLDSPIPRKMRARAIAGQLKNVGASALGGSLASVPDALSRALLGALEESSRATPEAFVAETRAQVVEPTSIPILTYPLQNLSSKTDPRRNPMADSTVTLSTPLLSAAEHLAEALAAAGPVAAYQRAKARLDADAQARGLLERLSSVQSDVRLRQSRGAVTPADLDNLRSLQRQVQSNAVIVEYARTQQAAVAYLPQINQEISQLIGVDFASLAGPASC